MHVPSQLTVHLATSSALGLADLIVHLKVTSGTKNPYFIQFPKTDPHGTAHLSREEFIGQFTDHWASGLMDYDGTLESASPQVEVALFDPTWTLENRYLAMAWPLLPFERTKWTSRQEEYQYRVSCRNLAFAAIPTVVNLEETPSFALLVEPRDVANGAA